MLVENDLDIVSKLKSIFGYNQFRGNQENIINNVLAGKNSFVIMPTGAGKSLCYQLPALMVKGTAIVISPLIALMKNQVDQLNALGVNAHFLNSTLSRSEIVRVKKETLDGSLKLLYVAPESLTKEENILFLRQANISFIAIDEAHCISEWGHDFRPEYRRIRSIVDNFGKLPIIALTATATPKVQQDIKRNLQMEEASIFKSSFNRENLYYEIKPKINAKKSLIQFVKNNKNKSGIIYCLSRKKVEEIAELLVVNDVKALPYHAGLDPQVRVANQDAFINENVDVIVATIAFGMGIDKPDVRFVIHYDVPKSLEGYYQETGRAGRDGLEGNCLMFYRYKDILKLEKFNKDKTVTERENAKHLLQEMVSYSVSSVCRRKQILHYFGEIFPKDCGFCDNCQKAKEKFEVMEEVVLVLKAAEQTGQRFAINHLTDVLSGHVTDYVHSYGHKDIEVFGKGAHIHPELWNTIVRQVVLAGLLEKEVEDIGVLKISKKGRSYLENPYFMTFSKDHDLNVEGEGFGTDKITAGKGYDQVLFEILKNLRKKVAQSRNLPPYVIFQDPSLEEMATVFPTNKEQLANINGVGQGKVSKFGLPFIDTIAKYVEENQIETANDVVVKSSVNKSKIKIFIIQQIDRKIDLEEIAQSKKMSMSELINEIEHICYSGTRLNLDYYLNEVMDTDRQADIQEYFMSSKSDSITLAMEELGSEDFTEEELRLVRVKFLSEYAN
jgi:ATP-dependent DNA helicase RecQ